MKRHFEAALSLLSGQQTRGGCLTEAELERRPAKGFQIPNPRVANLTALFQEANSSGLCFVDLMRGTAVEKTGYFDPHCRQFVDIRIHR